jgi:hypothetical protein
MIKYDMFATETNNKFADYELALSELEKNVQPVEDTPIEDKSDEVDEDEGTSINDIDAAESVNTIMSVDLKNIIKQELAASVN